MHAYCCMQQGQEREAKATKSLTSAVILPCPEGQFFRGNLIRIFKDPTLRVGAVRLHGE